MKRQIGGAKIATTKIATNDATVRLGLMPPLTGIVGIYGQEISRAGVIACEEVNNSGGILGRRLEIIIEDDGSLPESAVRSAEKLLDQHGCIALIGNLMTNSRIAVAYRVAEPRRIPYLCFSLYEGSVLSRYYFHFAALPNQQIDLMIPYMRRRYGPKMFFSGNNYEWPRGSIDAAKRALEKVKGQVVGEEYYPIGISSVEAQRLIEHVVQSEANVFGPYFAGSDELVVLNQLSKSGLKNKVQVVMSHYDEVMASHLTPEVREGLYSINSYFMSVDTQENRDFLNKLSVLPDVSGIWPRGNGIVTNFGEATYLCVKAFAKAANHAGCLESEAIVAKLETVSVRGPQGEVKMDRATHHAKINSYLARGLADGTFRVIKSFGAIEPVIPQRYRHMQIGPTSSMEDVRVQARIIEQMTDSVCLIDTSNNRVVYVNLGFERMFGYRKDEILEKPFNSLYASFNSNGKFNDNTMDNASGDPTPEITSERINKILYETGTWKGEIEFLRKDGTHFWTSLVISAFTHAHYGEVWIAILRDISELKSAADTLKENEKQFHTMFDSISQLAWIAHPDGYIFLYNQRWYEFTGTTPKQMEGWGWQSVHDPRILPEVMERWKSSIAKGQPFEMEFPLRGANGKFRWFLTSVLPFKNPKGQILRWFGTNTDITQIKDVEKEQAQLAAIVTSTDDAIISMDLNGIIKTWNLGAQKLFGYAAEEVMGRSVTRLIAPDRQIEEQNILDRLRHGERVTHFETVRLTKSQRQIEVSLTASPILDGTGRVIAASKIVRDITDRKRIESELIHAKETAENAARMRARFLDIAAHELGTPVTTFSMLLQYTEKQLEKGHPVDAATLRRLRGQSQRLARLVADLFDVSRLEHDVIKLQIERTDMASLISECLDGFRIQEPELKFVFEQPTIILGAIDIDRAKIMQVLSNLIDNAIKYTDKAAPIEVRIEAKPAALRVSVIDRGTGISNEQQKSLFEPLARGSSDRVERTSGMGLGLFISRSIVELHGGKMGVESKEGMGSTFYFELPRNPVARKAA